MKLRDLNFERCLKLAVYSIAIVTFLSALDYFSSKASINISTSARPVGFVGERIREFYEKNGLPIPDLFNRHPTISKIFKETPALDKDQLRLIAGAPPLELINAIKKGQSMEWAEIYSKTLEEHMNKYTFKPMIFGHMTNKFYSQECFTKILQEIKSRLLKDEYVVFLCALMLSRQVSHHVSITNDGDLDLTRLKIMFPSPFSIVTYERDGNILEFDVDSPILHNIEQHSDKVELHIPILKKQEFLVLNILTRENEIEKNEVFPSFDAERIINKKMTLLWAFILWIFFIGLTWFFRGKGK